jgi:hypothetical protein
MPREIKYIHEIRAITSLLEEVMPKINISRQDYNILEAILWQLNDLGKYSEVENYTLSRAIDIYHTASEYKTYGKRDFVLVNYGTCYYGVTCRDEFCPNKIWRSIENVNIEVHNSIKGKDYKWIPQWAGGAIDLFIKNKGYAGLPLSKFLLRIQSKAEAAEEAETQKEQKKIPKHRPATNYKQLYGFRRRLGRWEDEADRFDTRKYKEKKHISELRKRKDKSR